MKIGIITHYYDSRNYGGNLQAYALVEKIKKFNINVEQICYIKNQDRNNYKQFIGEKSSKISFKSFCIKVAKFVIFFPERICRYICYKKNKYNITRRGKTILRFNNTKIAHSDKVYVEENILDANDVYDIYIAGSDQVWNFEWYNKAFFLDFVSGDKKKISYAASIGLDSLTDEQKDIFRNSLKDFDAVSVREKSDVDLIKDLSPVEVVNTLDPTLLLDREDWDNVCADRVIEDKYLFCYFLGDNKNERKLAKQFAKKQGLKIVTLPHLNGYQKADKNFGDYKLWEVGPEKFISLIKYSDYVFTDSFHAVVFSNIYNKQYFVFNRSSNGAMSSRIYNITALFENPERFCDTKEKETLVYIENLDPIDYNRDFKKFKDMKELSIKFLKDNLGEPK